MTWEPKCSTSLTLKLVGKHEPEPIPSTSKAQNYPRKIHLNVIIPHLLILPNEDLPRGLPRKILHPLLLSPSNSPIFLSSRNSTQPAERGTIRPPPHVPRASMFSLCPPHPIVCHCVDTHDSNDNHVMTRSLLDWLMYTRGEGGVYKGWNRSRKRRESLPLHTHTGYFSVVSV
jgi:hypothetical protein